MAWENEEWRGRAGGAHVGLDWRRQAVSAAGAERQLAPHPTPPHPSPPPLLDPPAVPPRWRTPIKVFDNLLQMGLGCYTHHHLYPSPKSGYPSTFQVCVPACALCASAATLPSPPPPEAWHGGAAARGRSASLLAIASPALEPVPAGRHTTPHPTPACQPRHVAADGGGAGHGQRLAVAVLQQRVEQPELPRGAAAAGRPHHPPAAVQPHAVPQQPGAGAAAGAAAPPGSLFRLRRRPRLRRHCAGCAAGGTGGGAPRLHACHGGGCRGPAAQGGARAGGRRRPRGCYRAVRLLAARQVGWRVPPRAVLPPLRLGWALHRRLPTPCSPVDACTRPPPTPTPA